MASIEDGSFRLMIDEDHGGYAQFQEYGPGSWETVEDFPISTLQHVVDKADQGFDTGWFVSAGYLAVHWSPLAPDEIAIVEPSYLVCDHFVNFEVDKVRALLEGAA